MLLGVIKAFSHYRNNVKLKTGQMEVWAYIWIMPLSRSWTKKKQLTLICQFEFLLESFSYIKFSGNSAAKTSGALRLTLAPPQRSKCCSEKSQASTTNRCTYASMLAGDCVLSMLTACFQHAGPALGDSFWWGAGQAFSHVMTVRVINAVTWYRSHSASDIKTTLNEQQEATLNV